ncbi:hypothetical protein [Bacillus salacetis]|nr:hypothetical protein [Bacillus salacetis]
MHSRSGLGCADSHEIKKCRLPLEKMLTDHREEPESTHGEAGMQLIRMMQHPPVENYVYSALPGSCLLIENQIVPNTEQLLIKTAPQEKKLVLR